MTELLQRFIEDRASLSESEARELTAWLEANPSALEDLREQLVMDELLSRQAQKSHAEFVPRVRSALPMVKVLPDPFVGQVLDRAGVRSKVASRVWRPVAWSAIAAALAVMMFVWLKPEAPKVRLASATGDVRVWRDQVTSTVTGGFALKAGDWLLTGKDGAAEIEFPGETTRLKIGSDAEFGVVAAMPSKELKLTAGSLTASVARQSASHPMMIRTPTAKAEVLGTKFEMNATKQATRMTVTEGRVLIARNDDENGVVVEAQQTADVSEKDPVSVQAVPVAQTLAGGLIARWSFDEGAGLTAADSSGNRHTVTLNKEGAWSEGRFGKALDLHAVPVVALSTPVEFPSAFTISMWQRIEHGGPPHPQPLFTSDGEANRMNSLWLVMPPTSPGSGIVLGVSGPQMNSQARAKAGVILAGSWQHVAVCVDGVEGRATFFVDGRDVSMTSGLRAGFKLKAPVLIGRRFKDGPTPFDGQIDDVRIYGRILSGPEVSALAEGQSFSN
ncbi:MAG: FecR domain-containing protein [Verrucomicrobia bacterium]|nr:FecR domain-containing protein [Verrucomicrobiota bacterium]